MSDLFRSLASRAREGSPGGRETGAPTRLRPALDLSVAHAFLSSPEPQVSPDAWLAELREPFDPVEGPNTPAVTRSTEPWGRPPRVADHVPDHPNLPIPFEAPGRQAPPPARSESTPADPPAAAAAAPAPRVQARVVPLQVEARERQASPTLALEHDGSESGARPAALLSPTPIGAASFTTDEAPGSERGIEETDQGAGGELDTFGPPRLRRSEIVKPSVAPEERVAIKRFEPSREPRADTTPTIRVSIGRIEVRAVHPPSAPPAPIERAPTAQALSLEDYLKQRAEGRNG